MYTWNARIRFSEADENGRLKLTSLVDYFQDCSTFQSEDVGYGVRWLLDRRRVWVVNSWQIDIDRLPVSGERVVVGTIPYDIHGFMGLRNFFMDTPSGEHLAVANSVWSYLNIDTGEAVRAPEDMKEAYGLDQKLDMDYTPRKIPLPDGIDNAKTDPVRVSPENLDSNGHVNNGQYVAIACSVIPQGTAGFTDFRCDVRAQSVLGDVLYPRISEEDGVVHVVLNDPDGKPKLVARFS